MNETIIEAPAALPDSAPGDPRYPATRHALVLLRLGRRQSWRRGAEIGAFSGRNAVRLLEGLASLELLWCVDRWRQLRLSEEDGAETYARHDMAEVERVCRERLAPHGERARIVKATSARAAARVPDGSLDFVFIDALHTKAAVMADLRAWAPKVRAGGTIAGHDWWFPSVRAALDEAAPGWTRHEESVWTLPRDLYDAGTGDAP